PLVRPALAFDELAHVARGRLPELDVLAGQLPLSCELRRAVEGDPGADPRDRVEAPLVALPEPGVGPAPDPADEIGDLGEPLARLAIEHVAVRHVEADRLEQVAVGA